MAKNNKSENKQEEKGKFEKIGSVWENERSYKIKVDADIKKGEFVFMIKNKFKDQQKENAPEYNIFRVIKEEGL